MPILGGGSAIRAGSIDSWPSDTIPAGWLKCNGAAVSRTLYAALFNVIGTTYGAGDGSTTFNVPDMRGEFLRGLDDGRGVDTGRTIGSAQAADFASHGHSGSTDTHGGHSHAQFSNIGGGSVGAGGYSSSASANGTTGSAGAHSHAVTINATGGTETRPRNRAMHFIIKF